MKIVNLRNVSMAALLAVGVIGWGNNPAHALVVNQNANANALANEILGTGITVLGATVTGAPGAFGTFTGGASFGAGFPNNGILLSTGNAVDAVGPNSSDAVTTNFGTPGDAGLDGLISGTTQDAASLNISFSTAGGDLFFNYWFGSDEYNEFTNSNFNDVFALFVDGVNIALIPGTATPVSINNVNGGNPLGTGASNPALFNNNDLSDGGPFFDVEYDGFTDVFTAQALGLAPGSHTLKIAIGDVGDGAFDSGVFIQADTLSDVITPPTPPTNEVPEPGTLALFGIGLLGLGAMRRRRKAA